MYFVDYEKYRDCDGRKVMVYDLTDKHLSLYWVKCKLEIENLEIHFDGDTEYVEFYDGNFIMHRLYASSIWHRD